MPTNAQGVYEYTEGDTAATSSALLNKQSSALTAALQKRPRSAAGAVSDTTAGAGVVTSKAVTFPAGRFETPPAVVLQHTTGPVVAATIEVRPTNVTTEGFTLQSYRAAAGAQNFAVNWIAVEA